MKTAFAILLLCISSSLFAQEKGADLTFHVSKPVNKNLLYGTWMYTVDTLGYIEATFQKNGNVVWFYYSKTDTFFLKGQYSLAADTLLTRFDDATALDQVIIRQLDSTHLQWQYIPESGLPGVIEDLRRKRK